MAKRLTSDDVLMFARERIGGDIDGAIRIESFRPRYDVPGRRADGSIAGRHRVLWVSREHRVRGPKSCDALRFADASNHSKVRVPTLWLLESRERLVLLRERRGRLTTIWEARGADRPQLRRHGTLQWRDGATVELPVR
jgi:hypothetical protein